MVALGKVGGEVADVIFADHHGHSVGVVRIPRLGHQEARLILN
jgi:hypothetical protein